VPIVSQLSRIDLPSTAGDPVRLGELWERRAIVLCFIRHFG
jgi:hypothetical protein